MLLELLGIVVVPLFIGVLGGVTSATRIALKVRPGRRHLRDAREDFMTRAREWLARFNTAVFNRKTAYPHNLTKAIAEAAVHTVQGNSFVAIYRNQARAASKLARNLKKTGAVDLDWNEMKKVEPADIAIRPVRGGIIGRVKVSEVDAGIYQDYFREAMRMRKSVNTVLASYSPKGLNLPTITIDDVEKKGRLPDAETWINKVLEGYPETIEDVARNNGWEFYLVGIDSRGESPTIRLSSDAKTVMNSPHARPGADPKGISELSKRERKAFKSLMKRKRSAQGSPEIRALPKKGWAGR